MKNETFYELLKTMHHEETKTMVGKGKEYTIGSDDKLFNFKQVGSFLGISPLQVLAIYWLKHIFSICNYVKDGVEASDEGIEGRITDARNYLALMRALIHENKQQESKALQDNVSPQDRSWEVAENEC